MESNVELARLSSFSWNELEPPTPILLIASNKLLTKRLLIGGDGKGNCKQKKELDNAAYILLSSLFSVIRYENTYPRNMLIKLDFPAPESPVIPMFTPSFSDLSNWFLKNSLIPDTPFFFTYSLTSSAFVVSQSLIASETWPKLSISR